MPPENQAKLKKLQTFAEHQQLSIFNELQDLNDKIAQLIETIKSSEKEEISVNNLSDLNLDLTPLEANFDALKGSVDMVMHHIMGMKDMDMSGIEKLLKKIANKEDKEINLKELSNISTILEDVLLAVQTTASATALENPKQEELKPDLEKIQNILNTLNNNLVEFDIPDFDYKRLEDILKRNLKISVGGGGGINKHLLNASETVINPATEDKQNTLISNIKFPQGTPSDGTVALTLADTWYAVPATPPTADYILTITLETAIGTIRWARTNGTAPGTTFGQLAPETFPIDMKGGTSIYYASTTTGDVVNYSTIEQI